MPSAFSGGATKAAPKKKGPSTLNRIFDVLSRPQYASAEAVRRATGKGKGSILGGIGAGLTGKKKTSYATVLKEHNVKGPVGAIAGFAGDVLLDPTTYVPGGAIVKGASKAAKATGKGVAASGAVKALTATEGGAAVVKSAKTFKDELGKTFRTGQGLPDDIHAVKLKHGGISGQEYKARLHEVRDVFRGITSKERKQISRALHEGSYPQLPEHLQQAAEYARKHLAGKTTSKEKILWGNKDEDVAHVIARKMYKENAKKSYDAFIKEVNERFPKAMEDPEINKNVILVKKAFSNDPDVTNYFIKKFDKIQNIWKTQATVLNPGHHIRNLMGDTWMNFMDGVNVRAYGDAAKIISDHVTDASFTVNRFGKLNKALIKKLYEGQGLKSGFVQSENLLKGATRLKRTGKALEKVADATDKREDFTRYAHFIDALRKEAKKGGNLEAVAERAAARVRKYNFDYADLTTREKKYFKRVVPFYTFTRKALPVHLEMLFAKPGKIVAVPKGTRAIERLMGTRTNDEDPFPGLDHAIPPWYEDQHLINTDKNKVVAPSLPVDLLGQFTQGGPGGVGREVLGRTSPLIKSPVELAMGRDVQYGFKQTPGKYIPRQLTATRLAQQQMDKTGKEGKVLKVGGKNIDERQINWLTGLGIHNVNAPPAKRKKKGTKSRGGAFAKS